MSTISTFGASWGADAIAPLPLTRTQKTEAKTQAEAERLATMQPQTRQWGDVLTMPELDLLDLLAQDYAAEGLAGFVINVADLARRLGATTADAQRRLDVLLDKGAVVKTPRLMAAPVFRPVARNAGEAVTVISAKGETANVTPAAFGSSMGIRHGRA